MKNEKPETSPLQSVVTQLTSLLDGSQVRVCDIKAAMVGKKIQMSEKDGGEVLMKASVSVNIDRIGTARINFESDEEAKEYAATIAKLVNGAAG